MEKKLEPAELIRPFGPSIIKCKIPDEFIKILNKDCIEIGEDEEKRKNLDWSDYLAGRVKWEYRVRQEALKDLQVLISAWCKSLLMPLNIRSEEEAKQFGDSMQIGILSSWYIRQWKHEYNPVHFHTGCLLSSVGYLSLPEDIEEFWEEEDKDHNSSGGQIEWISGQMGLTNTTRLKVKPKVGDFYIFPAWLDHTVYPFNSKYDHPDPKGERRSFSCNMTYKFVDN